MKPLAYSLNYIFKYLPLVFGVHLAFGLTVNATIDRNKLSLDDVFELKIEAIDGSDAPHVDMSPLRKNFIVVNGPSQQTKICFTCNIR